MLRNQSALRMKTVAEGAIKSFLSAVRKSFVGIFQAYCAIMERKTDGARNKFPQQERLGNEIGMEKSAEIENNISRLEL
jgi:hypothetical protein